MILLLPGSSCSLKSFIPDIAYNYYFHFCRIYFRTLISPYTSVFCAYVDDIYQVAQMIKKQKDIRILKTKDYIQEPKASGYQSLHLILETAVPFQEDIQWIKIELQLRTAAMDYWANLDHQLRYKRGKKETQFIDEELQQCAAVIRALDQKMLTIRKKIDKI